MPNKPENVFVVMDAGFETLHVVHLKEEEAKNSAVAFANTLGATQIYEEYILRDPHSKEVKEAADDLKIQIDWLETQCGTHITVKAPVLLHLLKAVRKLK